jgi:hypothetical protein
MLSFVLCGVQQCKLCSKPFTQYTVSSSQPHA